MNKVVVLIFLRHYLPGYKYGGPTRTIANMVDYLGDEFELRIVTSDRDFQDTAPYQGLNFDQWSQQGKAWVYYASSRYRGIRLWLRLMQQTPHNVLYLNSLFDPLFTLAPLVASRFNRRPQPILIAPRGELSPGALDLKRWKKSFYLALAKILGMYRNVLWHASTVDEASLIHNCFGKKATVVIARNMPPLPKAKEPSESVACASSEKLHIVFLSRISRKKKSRLRIKSVFQDQCAYSF